MQAMMWTFKKSEGDHMPPPQSSRREIPWIQGSLWVAKVDPWICRDGPRHLGVPGRSRRQRPCGDRLAITEVEDTNGCGHDNRTCLPSGEWGTLRLNVDYTCISLDLIMFSFFSFLFSYCLITFLESSHKKRISGFFEKTQGSDSPLSQGHPQP